MAPPFRARGGRGRDKNNHRWNNAGGGGGNFGNGNGVNRRQWGNNQTRNNHNRHQNRPTNQHHDNNNNNGNRGGGNNISHTDDGYNARHQQNRNQGIKWNGNKRGLPWDTFVLDILREENFDPAKLRCLITAVAMLLEMYMNHRGGVSGQDLARELGLPVKATVKLFELGSRLLEGAFGPDSDGDIPMIDFDGNVGDTRINGSLTEPEKVIWDFITSRFLRGTQATWSNTDR